MGYLRREHAQPTVKLRCGDTEVQAIDLPLADSV